MDYKKTALICVAIFLVACNPVRPDQPCGDIPVWKAPQIDVPERPTLRGSTEGLQTIRLMELDVIDLTQYSIKLENIINTIKEYKPDTIK
jgi:hypothetical protein